MVAFSACAKRAGPRLNLPHPVHPTAYKHMAPFPFENIFSSDMERYYLRLPKSMLHRFLFAEYVLAWNMIYESGPLEIAVLIIASPETEESPYYIKDPIFSFSFHLCSYTLYFFYLRGTCVDMYI